MRKKMPHGKICGAGSFFAAISTEPAADSRAAGWTLPRSACACLGCLIIARYEFSTRAAAAYKVHDFQFVAIVQGGGFPVGAGNDFQIQLHGNAVRLHAELCD